MLFDLRSRGRRRTVQVIYVGLAFLMFGGLILFGVGAGNGFGGLLNAFTNGGNSGAQAQAINQTLRSAQKLARENPTSARAQGNLVEAYWSAANEGSNFDSTTGVYSATGKRYLGQATQAWTEYAELTDNPQFAIATIAAHSFARTSNWAGAAAAWESVTSSIPSAGSYFCFAASSYAAKQTRKGDLAAAQAVRRSPQLQRLTVKNELKAARTSPSTAQTVVASSC
jgi:hypothetical protein